MTDAELKAVFRLGASAIERLNTISRLADELDPHVDGNNDALRIKRQISQLLDITIAQLMEFRDDMHSAIGPTGDLIIVGNNEETERVAEAINTMLGL